MKIKNLKIEGYKNLDLELIHNADIIALIGNNGSGKSNLLEALSLIFRSLYKKSESVFFDYTIEYTIKENKNIKIVKSKSKTIFKVDNLPSVSIDEYLPKKVVAIYSGEEQRLWNTIYFPVYEDFIRGINQTSQKGLLSKTGLMPQMLYLNKYYWHISLLSLLISDLDDNKKFVSDVLKIKSVEKIKFDFNTSNYKNYVGNSVLDFIQGIDKKSEYTLDEFKNLIDLIYSDSDVFNYLYIANSPKGSKIIENITILYNEHLTIEDFSEGEKKLLLIKAAFEFAEQEDSLFILDEPDAHIHLNNKDQIIKTFDPYKEKRQIVLTTHSPTVTQAIDDENCLFMVNKGQIIERKKQEIISDLTNEFWNKHQQSSFLSSQKKLILLVEGKHDKLHIINAHNKLKTEYPTLDFDVFSLGGEGKIHPFMNGLYEANIQNQVIYIGLFDNDGAGEKSFKNGFLPIDNKNYRKLKEDKIKHNNFFAFTLIKPEGFTKDCTIENMFDCTKYEEAYKEALHKSIGNFANKSIEDINDNLKETSKNILAENSKNFILEDFKHFRKLFDLILEIKNLNKSVITPIVTPPVSPQNEAVKQEETNVEKTDKEEVSDEIKKPPLTFTNLKNKRSGRTVTEKQHLTAKPAQVKKMYALLKGEILEKDSSIVIDSKVEYIAFKRNKKNIFDIKILDKKIILWVNKKKGDIPVQNSTFFQDCSGKGHHGNGDYEIHFNSEAEVREFINVNVIDSILKI